MIKERPMIFSGPMVRGILDGSKTQTRRVVKPQPPRPGEFKYSKAPDKAFWREDWQKWWLVPGDVEESDPSPHTLYEYQCPYGKPGDRIWVKETWRPKQHNFPTGHPYDYRATAQQDLVPTEGPWKSPRFMPRVASRILLEITDVRVERLQGISEEDAIAEGVAHLFTAKEIEQNPRLAVSANSWYNYLWHGDSEAPTKYVNQWDYQYSGYKTAAGSYSSLWAKINGPESWHQNPFVWAITFKRLE